MAFCGKSFEERLSQQPVTGPRIRLTAEGIGCDQQRQQSRQNQARHQDGLGDDCLANGRGSDCLAFLMKFLPLSVDAGALFVKL